MLDMEVRMAVMKWRWIAALAAGMVVGSMAQAVTPQEQLTRLSGLAGQAAQAARGQAFFTSKHGKEWSCSTCHTAVPTVDGKHASTGKVISPMAPSANGNRFADVDKTEKWFRRNCNDVVGRECTPAEKADVLAWLLTL
jgi:hypothetical protein